MTRLIKAMNHRPIEKGSEPNLALSVITPCLNASKTIRDTICSVAKAKQIMMDKGMLIEHIIVDGGSTDDTILLVKKHMEKCQYLRIIPQVSKGIYAAMNIGLEQAKGKYTHIINADDMIIDPAKYAQLIFNGLKSEADTLICSIAYFKRPSKKVTSVWISQAISKNPDEWYQKLRQGLHYPHPGFIATTYLYNKYKFDTRYDLSADYKLMQNILIRGDMNQRTIISQDILVGMAEGGASSGFKSIIKGVHQIKQINRELGITGIVAKRYYTKILRLIIRQSHKTKIPGDDEENTHETHRKPKG